MVSEPARASMASGVALRSEAVGVAVDGRTILKANDLTFDRGKVVGIVGHNGSGKSTLLKCLARQVTPTSGRVLLQGRNAQSWGARAFAQQLAYLPQQTPASTGLLGRELVAFGRYPWHGPLGRVGSHGHHVVDEAMRLTATVPFRDRPVDQLSGGERQRVWIAMLVAQDTDFVLLDEPIAALDLAHQIEVLGVLRDLARRRTAGIILVLHDINMAARFCDRIVALRDGAVIADGSPDAILRADVLQAIYDIPMRVIADDVAGAVAVPA